VGTM